MGKEIKIAGAGISGLTSAIILSKAGYKVKIFEKNSDVGFSHNEDFQVLMNWGFGKDILEQMEEFGLRKDFWVSSLFALDICGPDGFQQNFTLKKPFCYLIQRGNEDASLDQSLKRQALEQGVEIIFRSPKKAEEVDIIATGPVFDGVTDGLAHGYTFETDAQAMFSIIFDHEYAHNGYSYLLIAGGKGTIATRIFGDYGNVNEYIKKTSEFFTHKYAFNMRNEKKFSGCGNFFFLESNRRYVGEAGGFEDFFWGSGIRYAMITGRLAAKSIIENKEYGKLWKRELDSLLKISVSVRFLFAAFGWRTYKAFIIILSKQKNLIAFFDWVYSSTAIKLLIYPLAKIYFGKYIKDRISK